MSCLFLRTFQGLFKDFFDLTYVLHNHYNHYNHYNLLTFPNLYCRFISSKLHFYIHFFCWDGKTRFMGTDLCIQKKIGTTLQFFLPLTTAHCACTNKAVGISSVVKFLWSWALQRKIFFVQKKTHTSHPDEFSKSLQQPLCELKIDWSRQIALTTLHLPFYIPIFSNELPRNSKKVAKSTGSLQKSL